MKNLFKIGDQKKYSKQVNSADLAAFESGVVHQVYGTFALGRDAEWVCRLFVLDMKENNEEGIGTFLNITHHSPALLGQTVDFLAIITLLEKNRIDCSFEAKVGERLIANGTQGQKIISKEKLTHIFNQLQV